jgi:hypothetical protein
MRRVSNPVQGVGLPGPTPWLAALAVCLAPALAMAHVTAEEVAEQARLKTLCSREANPGERFDSVGLGAQESELRSAWGDGLLALPIEQLDPELYRPTLPRNAGEAEAAPTRNRYAEQIRLRRAVSESDVRSVEYELFRGRVYRTRWELGDRFHTRFMDELVHQATHCYGAPVYDQTIEAKIASGEANRRRAGWRRGGRLLEIRQLNPLLGGPVFVTVTDIDASQEIIAARGTLAPEPERRAEPWWKRAGEPPQLPSEEKRAALVRAVAAVLSQTDF